MWLSEHSVETAASPESIWRLWSSIDSWTSWDPRIEKVEADGPLAVGTRIRLTEHGHEPADARVAAVMDGSSFTIEFGVGAATARFVYRIAEWAGQSRVYLRAEIAGPGSDEVGGQVGPSMVARFPQTLASLVRHAEGHA